MYTTCTVPFVRVAIFVCVWAAVRLQHFHTLGQQYAGPSSKVIPKPSTMASETHSSSSISITWMPWCMIPPGTSNIPPDHPTQHGSPTVVSRPKNLSSSCFGKKIHCVFFVSVFRDWFQVHSRIQLNMAVRQTHLLPVVSRPENLSSSSYITAQKSVRVFFCLSFLIDFGTTCDASQNE